ncbi:MULTISPECIES: 16S rRNA (guanine(966)-N(2))-methyltransferase RsmD [Flavobacterium]|uniref:16S rRNA (guanine(966)-N(2))-methyltransferase RsmD n=1 Tax=Flavobacterium TaxID=237 RepID=UPI000959E384|nr:MULTISPECIES: 16S rRNA (guanine(966)-N(2))-methyltransferase RsmD [Flavobacterium]MBN9284544.1 16S rRNA (guanine(966)-N(2))-methyltransferase RsmD [Flavobacterium sp.]OJV72838.1 MAG: 16S rRNA (guanine(966)-N(2))-methyltransferase RsmD [Flavobacterium sp. 40-81]
MRIISGKYKGRRINPPKNLPVRPTTDMSKESLFNILNNYFNFSELRVLDLFAGTGNISYEFASRGSGPITSVDGDFGCVNFIKKTAKEFDFDITAIKSDVFKFLEKSKASYDIIFADPPYGMEKKDFEKIVELVFQNELLETDGMMIIEHSKHTPINHMDNFSFLKNYGGSVFSFFEFENDSEEDVTDEEDEFDS